MVRLLQKNCIACHRQGKREGGLNLESRDELLRGGDSGLILDFSHPESSSILARVGSIDSDDRMPPPDNKVGAVPLSTSEIEQLRAWIERGATYPPSAEPRSSDGQSRTIPVTVRSAYSLRFLGSSNAFVYGQGGDLIASKVVASEEKPMLMPQDRIGSAPELFFALADSANGDTLFSGHYSTMRVWRRESTDASTENTWRAFDISTSLAKTCFSERVNALALDSNEKYLAIGSGIASRTGHLAVVAVDEFFASPERLTDETWGPTVILNLSELHSDSILGLAFNADGSRLATCGADKMIRIVDVRTKAVLGKLEGHTHHVLSVAWSPDGKELVSASADGSIKVWDLDEAQAKRTISLGSEITGLAFIGGSNQFVSSSIDGKVRLHDTQSNNTLREYQGARGALQAVSVSRHAKIVAACGESGELYAWQIEDGKAITTVSPAP